MHEQKDYFTTSSMRDTATKIAAGLERAFAARGFSEPCVDDLREAAGVSLRTLYKYTPSRDAMVRMALVKWSRFFGQPGSVSKVYRI